MKVNKKQQAAWAHAHRMAVHAANSERALMKTCMVHDVEVKVGDMVAFHEDGCEQWAKVADIMESDSGYELLLVNKHGFSGPTIGGRQMTIRSASDCWAD